MYITMLPSEHCTGDPIRLEGHLCELIYESLSFPATGGWSTCGARSALRWTWLMERALWDKFGTIHLIHQKYQNCVSSRTQAYFRKANHGAVITVYLL